MFCKKCGRILNEGDTVCPSCGAAVNNVSQSPLGMQPEVNTQPPLGMQPEVNTQPPLGMQPEVNAQSPLGMQPEVNTQPPLGMQPEVNTQPPLGMQPEVNTQPPLGMQPEVNTQPPLGMQPEVNTQPPLGMQSEVNTQSPLGMQSEVNTQSPLGMQPQMNAQPPLGMQPQMNAQPPLGMQPQVGEQINKKKNDKMIILIIILALVVIVAVILSVVLINKNKSSKGTTPNQSAQNTTTTSVASQKTETYDGYNFIIPDGYESEINDYGLTIYNSSVIYTIKVDRTISYEQARDQLVNEYNYNKEDVSINVSGREYAGIVSTTDEGNIISIYATKATDSSVFFGFISKSNNENPTMNDFNFLNNILNNAKANSSSFAANSDSQGSKLADLDVKSFNFTFKNN